MNNSIPILLYHSIDTKSSREFQRWVVSPDLFAEQMAYLHQHKYTPMSVTEFIFSRASGHMQMPAKPILITFDDGLADFYTNALPILRQYNFPATIYISTRYINYSSFWLAAEGEANRKMMSWNQVKELPENGIEVGAHTHSHPQLDLLSIKDAEEEIVHSKQLLEQHLDHPIQSFAYPHGFFNGRIQKLVQKAGFSSACAVKHALSSIEDDPFALSRIIISNDTSVAEMAKLIQSNKLRVAPQRERLRTKAWRMKRRLVFAFK